MGDNVTICCQSYQMNLVLLLSQVRLERAKPVGRGHALRAPRGDRHYEKPPLRRTLQGQELRFRHSQPGKSMMVDWAWN